MELLDLEAEARTTATPLSDGLRLVAFFSKVPFMGRWVHWLDARLYPGYQHRWDDALFRDRILSRLGGGMMSSILVLELGLLRR